MPHRPGDETDDYCTRCHLLTNHSVAAMVGDAIAQTTCRTCGFTHDYKHARAPLRAKPKAASAFDEVLAGILGSAPPPPPPYAKRSSRNLKTRAKSPAKPKQGK